jgi:thermitase
MIPSRYLARLSVLLTILFLGSGGPRRVLADSPAECVPGEVLVGLQPEYEVPDEIEQLVAAVGPEVEWQPTLGVHRLRLRPGVSIEEALEWLQQFPGVRFAEPNGILYAHATPNDPYFASTQYGPQLVQADRAWEIWQPQAPVVIAIVDTGIDATHPDLTQKILRDASGIVGYNAFTQQRADAADDHWHGTHCAGIAAAQVNNATGTAGIAGWNGVAGASDTTYVKLMPVKVLDSQGSGSDLTVADGILWAADHGARVISMSLGSTGTSSTMGDAVQYALDKGCVVVAAAGNNGSSSRSYPAGFPGAIAVAATDRTDRLASFSNYGSWVPVAAPGVMVVSTMPTYATAAGAPLNYAYASGTSMSCPHVAGEAALLLTQNPALTNSQVAGLITANVDPYTPYLGRTLAAGGGRINVFRALQSAFGTTANLTSLTLTPKSLTGGATSTGKVLLSAPAPAEGAVVLLSSADAAAAVPASVTVPAGATTATFPVTTTPVTASRSVTLSANYNNVTRTASLSILAPALSSVTLKPARVKGGTPVTGTVALNAPAPAGGVVVQLSRVRVTAPTTGSVPVTVPSSVTVQEGTSKADFPITTKAVSSNIMVRISATLRGRVASSTLTVTP